MISNCDFALRSGILAVGAPDRSPRVSATLSRGSRLVPQSRLVPARGCDWILYRLVPQTGPRAMSAIFQFADILGLRAGPRECCDASSVRWTVAVIAPLNNFEKGSVERVPPSTRLVFVLLTYTVILE
jgi:hypothetical protein